MCYSCKIKPISYYIDQIEFVQVKMDMKMLRILLIILCGMLMYVSSEMKEVCNGENFSAKCSRNEVIIMDTAEYGRMTFGKCIKSGQEHMGCSNDVLHLTDLWCSGRRECNAIVPNGELDKANIACKEYLRLYFQASFHCIKVVPEDAGRCDGTPHVSLPANEGFISSHLADETGCVSSRSPGRIQATPGQRIKFTLIDFGSTSMKREAGPVYGYIMDKVIGTNKTIYGGNQRQKEVYTSESSTVEIALATGDDTPGFLLRYTVIGCPDLTAPDNSYYKRNGNEATIGCNGSSKRWTLECQGGSWIGVVGNCTEEVAKESKEGVKKPGMSFIFYITIGGAGGVVLLVIIIVVCCVYCKRRRIKNDNTPKPVLPIYGLVNGTLTTPTTSRKPGQYRTIDSKGEELVYNVGARTCPLVFTKDGAMLRKDLPLPDVPPNNVMMLTQPEPEVPAKSHANDLLDLCIPPPLPDASLIPTDDETPSNPSTLGGATQTRPPPPEDKYEIVQVKFRPKSGVIEDSTPAASENQDDVVVPVRKGSATSSSGTSSPVSAASSGPNALYMNVPASTKPKPKRPPRRCDDDKSRDPSRSPLLKKKNSASPVHTPTGAAAALAAVLNGSKLDKTQPKENGLLDENAIAMETDDAKEHAVAMEKENTLKKQDTMPHYTPIQKTTDSLNKGKTITECDGGCTYNNCDCAKCSGVDLKV